MVGSGGELSQAAGTTPVVHAGDREGAGAEARYSLRAAGRPSFGGFIEI